MKRPEDDVDEVDDGRLEGPAEAPPGGPSEAPRSVSATPWVLLVAAACFVLAGLLQAGGSPSGFLGVVRTCLALALVLGGGVALGPLLRWTPTVEPSPLKLAVFSSLAGPALVGALALASTELAGFRGASAWSAVFVASGCLAFLGLGRRIGVERSGLSAGLACAFGLALALVGAQLVGSEAGLAARVASTGATAHATLADGLVEGAPWSSPWLAGMGTALRRVPAIWLSAVAGPAGLAPLSAIALLVGWSLALCTVLAYLLAAALHHERPARGAGLRDLAAAIGTPLAVAGPGAAAWFSKPAAQAEPGLRWLEVDPSIVAATATGLGTLLAGVHAARSGARPWPGLCALLLAATALLEPMTGLALAVALVAASWLSPARDAGLRTLSLTALALLPAFVQWRVAAGAAGGAAWWSDGGIGAEVDSARLTWPLAIFALGVGALALLRPSGDRRRALAGGALIAGVVLTCAVLARWLDAPAAAVLGRFGLMAAVPLLVGALPRARSGALALGVPAGLLLVLGAVRFPLPTHEPRVPFEETTAGELRLLNADPLTAGLDEAFAFLRGSAYAGREDVLLLRSSPGPSRAGEPAPSSGTPGLPAPPSLAPLLAGIDLWVDSHRPPGSVAGAPELPTSIGDSWTERVGVLDALYHARNAWRPQHQRLVEAALERGVKIVAIVTELDRRRTTDRGSGPRGVDVVLHHRLGARALFDSGETTVYLLER